MDNNAINSSAPVPSAPQLDNRQSPTPAPGAASVTGPVARPRLRLWPGVIILALIWLAYFGPKWLAPGTDIQMYATMMTPLVAILGLLAWWLLASRLRWADRIMGLVAFFAVGGVSFFLLDHSFGADPGMRTFM